MEIRVVKAGLSGVASHKASHEPSGEDALTELTAASFATAYKDGAPELQALRSLGTAAGQALPGDHASVTNARTPSAHKASHEPGGTDALTLLTEAAFAAASKDGGDDVYSLRRLGTGAQRAAKGDHLHDSRYVRTVNGDGPDVDGNVVVDAGGGASGVGSIEGVAPNAPGGDIDFTSTGGTVAFTPNNAADSLNFDIPAHTATAALPVDPASTDTVRNKHVSNADIKNRPLSTDLETYLPPHGFWGTLAITTGKGRIPIFRAGTITNIRLAAGTAPTGASVVVVVKVNGSTAATVTLTASSNAVLSSGLTIAVAAGDYLTADITQVGSTVAGADLTVSYLHKLS